MSGDVVEVWDDLAETADRPFTCWAVLVTYPPEAAHRFAGMTVRLRTDRDQTMAGLRRDWHLNNGATSATVQRQDWTPSEWKDQP